MRPYRLFGLTLIDQTMAEAVRDVGRLAIAGKGARSVFFVNAHTLNLAASDPDYAAVLSRASRIYGDGAGVRWAARSRGVRLQANLNGTDLIPALMTSGQAVRCFLLGSSPERTGRITVRFRDLFPDVKLVGAHHGYVDDAESQDVIKTIEASGANLVLVGMGNPLQERWIDRHAAALPQALCIGVGGLMEYWSGALDRAPAWVRRLGLEWLHIMLRQPWKSARYLIGNPVYMLRAMIRRRADMADCAASLPASGGPARV